MCGPMRTNYAKYAFDVVVPYNVANEMYVSPVILVLGLVLHVLPVSGGGPSPLSNR